MITAQEARDLVTQNSRHQEQLKINCLNMIPNVVRRLIENEAQIGNTLLSTRASDIYERVLGTTNGPNYELKTANQNLISLAIQQEIQNLHRNGFKVSVEPLPGNQCYLIEW